MEHSGEILSPYEIYEEVWHEPFLFSSGNTVMVHIRGLRKKIEKDPQHPQILRTIYGRGYQFCTPLADSKS